MAIQTWMCKGKQKFRPSQKQINVFRLMCVSVRKTEGEGWSYTCHMFTREKYILRLGNVIKTTTKMCQECQKRVFLTEIRLTFVITVVLKFVDFRSKKYK